MRHAKLSLRERLRRAEAQAKGATAQAQRANYVIVAILRQSGDEYNLAPEVLKALDETLKTSNIGWTLQGNEFGGAQITLQGVSQLPDGRKKVTITHVPEGSEYGETE